MAVTAQQTLDVDEDAIASIASRLDLREPNVEALRAIAYTASQHYDVEGREPPYECVIDVATGVGKTFVLAAAIEYYAARGVTHFAVVTPGRTILEKTIANFTPGHPKSLLGGMDVEPLIVTAENFATVDHAEPDRVRLYVFSVQSLIKPTAKQGRRVHTFQETLGDAFYEYLQARDDLVLFADEHHVYYGKAFSQAIRDLEPRLLVGLTATPEKSTPREQIVYAYPLAHAIADRLVKTPVIVGRRDDRKDERTKLADGIRLLEAKRDAVERYCAVTGATPVNPVMLVIATTIEEAEGAAATFRDPQFFEGRYDGDAVLTVHSKAPEEALAALDTVEDADSPVRVIVSVGMLKEGWDVKNVYVICSLRPMLSELLQEQTLGRGLRLPFGRYTDVRMLDTLEVIAHDKYEQLLKKKGVIEQEFVDWRTRLVVHTDPLGDESVSVETLETLVDVQVGTGEGGAPALEELEAHEEQVAAELEALAQPLVPRGGRTIPLPKLTMTPVKMSFSLNDITEHDTFERLGRQFATAPEDDLRREEIVAEVERGADGLVVTRLGTRRGERVEASADIVPLDDLRERLVDALLYADVVTLRVGEDAGARRIVEAFLRGVGDDAERTLSAFLPTAAGRLVRAVTQEHRRFLANPEYDTVVSVDEYGPQRTARAETSSDRTGTWRRGVGYLGFEKSLYDQDWFDSGTEKSVAVILDDADEVDVWVRLQRGDLKIVWESDGRGYAPDFVAVEGDGTHWVVEAKADRDVDTEAVKGKELAARRWAQHVSAQTGVEWRYLLVGETDVADARGSWSALKQLGR